MVCNCTDIALDKKRRMEFQNKLIKKFNMPLVVMRVNYPGENKSNDITNNIIESMDAIVSDIFSPYIYFKILRITAEGPILILIINKNASEIKRTTVEIENKHILGRCVDIDVYGEDGKKISRIDLGYTPRECYICNNTAKECIKEKRHVQDEIVQYIVGKYREYIESFYGKRI